MLYVQNAGNENVSISNSYRGAIDFILNGKYAGGCENIRHRRHMYFDSSLSPTEYITLKPGEILKASLPVANLDTHRVGRIDQHLIDSTYYPGTYRIQATYREHRDRNYPGWWKNQMVSNELEINVHPRVKDGFEDNIFFDTDIPTPLFIGPQKNPYIVKADSMRFEGVDLNACATLRISFRTAVMSPKFEFEWKTKLEIISAAGKVLCEKEVIENNQGKAKIIDRKIQFLLGSYNKISNAKRFRISFIAMN